MNEYPKEVRPCDVAGGFWGEDLFMLPGGRAKYEEVHVCDGATGNAFYLRRLEQRADGFHVVSRYIPWNQKVIQLREQP